MVLIKALFIKKWALLLLVTLIAAVFIGGMLPGAGDLLTPPWDKLAHFAIFGIMAILISMAFPPLSLLFVFIISMTLGCLDETHQIFIKGRHPGVDDLIADLVGIVIGLLVSSKLRQFIYNKH